MLVASLICLNVTAWCSYDFIHVCAKSLLCTWPRDAVPVTDSHSTLAHHRISSSSVVRVSGKIMEGHGFQVFSRCYFWIMCTIGICGWVSADTRDWPSINTQSTSQSTLDRVSIECQLRYCSSVNQVLTGGWSRVNQLVLIDWRCL